MNKSLIIVLAIVGTLVISFSLVYFGFALARLGWFPQVWSSNAHHMAGYPMQESCAYFDSKGSAFGMMGRHGFGNSTMESCALSPGEAAEPLSITVVDDAVHEYIESFQDDDLVLGEIMIFDNHGYAQIVEKSTGIGAMEVIIDPVTLAVYPEHGPNMMWNLKYSHMEGMMAGNGIMGFGQTDLTPQEAEDMPVTTQEAGEAAQRYLDRYVSGKQVDDHADQFYGYYTLHVLQDGEVTGMLSVNGFTGEVFLHTWHGDFIEMSEH